MMCTESSFDWYRIVVKIVVSLMIKKLQIKSLHPVLFGNLLSAVGLLFSLLGLSVRNLTEKLAQLGNFFGSRLYIIQGLYHLIF